MNKRLISLVLTFIMLITMVPSTIVEASEVTTMERVKASSNQSEVTKPEDNIFRIMTVPFYISESRWLAEKRK